MGVYAKGICNKCGMGRSPRTINSQIKRQYVIGYCHREIPQIKYNWININDSLPEKGQTVLVKSHRYGVQRGILIGARKGKYKPLIWQSGKLNKGKRSVSYSDIWFSIKCQAAAYHYDYDVIQWAEINDI